MLFQYRNSIQVYVWVGMLLDHFIMPPTLKKLEGHIAFGLSVCVCVCVCACVRLLTFER